MTWDRRDQTVTGQCCGSRVGVWVLLSDTLGCHCLSSQPFWGQSVEGTCKETAPLPYKCGFPGDFLADVRQCMGKTSTWSLRCSWEGAVPIQNGALLQNLAWSLWVHQEGPLRGDGECGCQRSDANGLLWQGEGAEPQGAAGAETQPPSAPAPLSQSLGDTTSACPDCASAL